MFLINDSINLFMNNKLLKHSQKLNQIDFSEINEGDWINFDDYITLLNQFDYFVKNNIYFSDDEKLFIENDVVYMIGKRSFKCMFLGIRIGNINLLVKKEHKSLKDFIKENISKNKIKEAFFYLIIY